MQTARMIDFPLAARSNWTALRVLLAWALVSLALAGCKSEVAPEPTPSPGGQAVATVAANLPSGTELALPRLTGDDAAPDEDSDEEVEEDDYWKDVAFDASNFDEVLQYVSNHYIDPQVDESRAFAEACAYAFAYLETSYYVYPKTFYDQRKGHEAEEGELDGPSFAVPGVPNVVAVKAPTEEERKAKDDAEKEARKGKTRTDAERRKEILEARAKLDVRRKLLDQTWAQVPMTRQSVDRCVAEAVKLGKKDGNDKREDLEKWIWLGAASGYLRALDPHSSVVSEKAWEESTRRTQDSSFDGIGAILTKRDEYVMVESPIEGQPAVEAGLRAGDKIVRVDDKTVIDWPLHKVVKRIRGKRGTIVTLIVRREGEPEDLAISIKRSYIKMQNVESKFIKEHKDIGYVKLSGFVPDSARNVREAIAELEKQTTTGRLRGLILDLRRNSGGLLNQAVDIADIFLDSGTIVTVKDRVNSRGSERAHEAVKSGAGAKGATPQEWTDLPLVVLVNDSSASASEIVAGAIQDNHRGLIVGDRSFGKASVQTLFNPDKGKDYYIKLTVARYYAPSGRTIQVVGISPDFQVPPEVDDEMPIGFREENLSNPLGAIETSYHVDNAQVVEAVDTCVKRRGIAEKMHQADPNPQVRFDYQLMKAADYLECLGDLQQRSRVAQPRRFENK